MKRVLCLLLCMVLAMPFASAETADTLPKKFARQLSGGNGVRGYASITASGVADWLSYLLPFTASDIQIRAIGEKQGEMSEYISDDDDWQVKLYTENSAEEEVGVTWLYGDPQGVYFQSELIPDTVLTIPVENVHMLYQFFSGEWSKLFFAFDPMNMLTPGTNGNTSSYTAVAEVLGVPADEWDSQWLPVLENYFLQLDLWLASYGGSSYVSGEDKGSLTMSVDYTIPANALKAEMKYIISQMLFDHDLQNLLLPYVTMDQRVIYLNPSMVYFYEACIDALPLEGDLIFSREMTAMGEIISTMVSLPMPALPDSLTGPMDALAADVFGLENMKILDGVNRMVLEQKGNEKSLTLSGDKHSIILEMTESHPDENTTAWDGTIKLIPAADSQDKALSAEFACSAGHKLWQDEKYLDHDTTEFSISIAPALDNPDADDPFRSAYAEFDPLALAFTLDFRNNPHQANSAVQINLDVDAQLPGADVQAKVVLRITTQMQLSNLQNEGAQDFTAMTEEQKSELLRQLVEGAVKAMAGLNTDVLDEPVIEEVAADDAEAQPEPTVVPPADLSADE